MAVETWAARVSRFGASNRNANMKRFAGFRVSSTFFKTIKKMHRQLSARGAVPTGAAFLGNLVGAEQAVRYGESTWKCKADGKSCVEYTRAVG